MENTELALSLLIPTVASSVEEQILTLKHTLCKHTGLPTWAKRDASLGMLRYMQSLESQKRHGLMQSILDGLTETELEELQDLVEYAKELSKSLEYAKSTTHSKEIEELYKELFKHELSKGHLHPTLQPKITGKLS
jgi:hypothetical protein